MGTLSGHPNIVTVFEFAEENNQPHIVMEFLRGSPLSEPFAVSEQQRIYACDAKAAARGAFPFRFSGQAHGAAQPPRQPRAVSDRIVPTHQRDRMILRRRRADCSLLELEYARDEPAPDVINIPYALLIGLAAVIIIVVMFIVFSVLGSFRRGGRGRRYRSGRHRGGIDPFVVAVKRGTGAVR